VPVKHFFRNTCIGKEWEHVNTRYPSASDDVAAPGKFEAERFAFTAQEWLPDTPILDVDTATQCVSHSLIKSVEKMGVNLASTSSHIAFAR
jgi:hypothetical protein